MADFKTLADVRGGPCISLYLETTSVTSEIAASRIAFGNLAKDALSQLQAAGTDKRVAAELMEPFDDLADDPEFWAHQARSLAVLATQHSFQTFRLANRLTSMVEVSDRFHLKPLLRAVTFPHTGFVLALSENGVRLIEFFSDLPPEEVRVADLPKDAASHAGKASLNDRSHSARIHGSEGKKVRLRQYARAVAAAIRPVVTVTSAPVILAANEPLATIFRHEFPHSRLATGVIGGSIDRLAPTELAAEARPILDAEYARHLEAFRTLFATRTKQNRVTTDLATAARAATFGAVEAMMVDIDGVVLGTIDAETGAIEVTGEAGVDSYGIVDQIAMRALLTGADVLGVRRQDIPADAPLAAILRYPV